MTSDLSLIDSNVVMSIIDMCYRVVDLVVAVQLDLVVAVVVVVRKACCLFCLVVCFGSWCWPVICL